MKNKEILDNFLTCLKKEEFYEAHEELEKIWYPRRLEKSDEINFIKGLINASVSFELRKKGKIEQSNKVWRTYEKYKDLIKNIESDYINQYKILIKLIDNIKNYK